MFNFPRHCRTVFPLIKFMCGGLMYCALEVIWRGYTHISMFLLGGFCFVVLVRLHRTKVHFCVKCAAGCAIITAGELAVGFVVNIWLKLGVWDYSLESLHFAGQICPRFCLLWFVLCVLVYSVMGLLDKHPQRRKRSSEQMESYRVYEFKYADPF